MKRDKIELLKDVLILTMIILWGLIGGVRFNCSHC